MPRLLAALSVLVSATLAAAGPGQKEADRAVADLRTSKDPKVRAAALKEIGRLGQVRKALVEAALGDVEKCLTDKEAEVRAEAARCYGMTDPDPKPAVPALLKMAQDEKEELKVRVAAVEGLGAIGTGAKDALPELRKLVVRNPEPGDRKARELNNAVNQATRQIMPRKQQ